MNLAKLFQEVTLKLQQAGISKPELDASLLLCEALSQTTGKVWTKVKLFSERDFVPPKRTLIKLEKLVCERVKRRPIAQILKRREFFGYSFIVSRSTLDPRPESEKIIEIALEKVSTTLSLISPLRVLDIGTGCGVLAISFAKEMAKRKQSARITALDISKRALEVAFKNAFSLGFQKEGHLWILKEYPRIRLKFLLSNLLKGVPPEEKFDLIMANLPYIPDRLKKALLPETQFEPKIALFGGKDGLTLYRRLRKEIEKNLLPHSELIFECSKNQLPELLRLFLGMNISLVT